MLVSADNPVPNASPDNDYRVGINQCEAYCTARADCQFFFYLRFDPARARGADYAYCFIGTSEAALNPPPPQHV